MASVLFGTAVIHLADALADAHFLLWPAVAGSLVVAVISAVTAVWPFRRPAGNKLPV